VRANLPDKNYFIAKAIPSRPDVTVVNWVNSGNNAHLFRARSQILKRDLACKVIPRSNLLRDSAGNEIWQAEVHKADALRSSVVVKFEDVKEWRDAEAGIDCVVLLSEFVEGLCLRDFLLEHPDIITVPLIMNWLGTMLNLFNEMARREVTHGDLHTGNVLVEDRSSYDLQGPRYVFRVTDFGVAEATSDQRFKDDYQQLADILAQLLQLVKYPACSPKEKFIFNILRNNFLARHLVETDLTLDPLARRPPELFRAFRAPKTAG
jgi:serine/threonine protein kinase